MLGQFIVAGSIMGPIEMSSIIPAIDSPKTDVEMDLVSKRESFRCIELF